MYGIVC